MKTRFVAGLASVVAAAILAPLSMDTLRAEPSVAVPVPPGPSYAGYPNYANRYPRFHGIAKKPGFGMYPRYPYYYTGRRSPESLYRPYRVTGGYYYPRYYYKSHVGKFGLPYIHVRYEPEPSRAPYEHFYHHDDRRIVR